jgi:two-component system, OmpR family, sensor kinase
MTTALAMLDSVPLRWRLTLAFAAGMTAVLVAMGMFVSVRLRADLTESIDEGLLSQAQFVTTAVDRGDPLSNDQRIVDIDDALAQVVAADGHVTASASPLASAPFLTLAQIATVQGPTFFETDDPELGTQIRVLAVEREFSDPVSYVVVARTLDDRDEALARLRVQSAIGGVAALALSAGLGWVLAGAALRPVERMRREAAAISVSEPDRRLSLPAADDELRRLAGTINDMLERLQTSMQGEREYLDRASHELRTPLSVLKGEIDLALSRARTVDELQAALERSADEVDTLVRLAEDLLVLSRLQQGRLPIRKERVEVGPLLERVTAGFATRASAAGIRLDVDVDGSGDIRADPVRIRQAVSNLVDNAIRFTPRDGTIVVSARTVGDGARIVVEDSGAGFSVDADDGLGLEIVKAVALAHGGRVEIGDGPGGGGRVALEIPAE